MLGATSGGGLKDENRNNIYAMAMWLLEHMHSEVMETDDFGQYVFDSHCHKFRSVVG